MGYSLGVDLGTGYTAAAVSRDGRVDAVPLGDRADYVPSVIYVSPQGAFSFGEPAERHASAEPERMEREFKQRIGTDRHDSDRSRQDSRMGAAGPSLSAEASSRALLEWVLDEVVAGQGGPPDQVTIAYPAPWRPYQLGAMKDDVAAPVPYPVGFCTEPEAAAFHHASSAQLPDQGTIAVYDLGTGTFDVAVLRRTRDGRFDVLGQPVGLPECGGLHFDDEIFQWVLRTTDNDELDFDDLAIFTALKRLRRECCDAKEALSRETEAIIPVVLPQSATKVRLTRDDFQDLIRPKVVATVDCLEEAIESAGLDPSELSAVVLAGGSARTPLVKEMVTARLGRPVTLSPKPKLCVAMGAAMIGDVRIPSPTSRPAASARGTPNPSTPKGTMITAGARRAAASPSSPPPVRSKVAAVESSEVAATGLLARLPRLSWYRYTTIGLALFAILLALVGPVVPIGSGRYTWDSNFTVSVPQPDGTEITPKIWGVPVPGLDPVTVERGTFSLAPYRFVLGGPVGAEVAVGPGRAQIELAPAAFTSARFLNVGFAAMILCLMFSYAYLTSLLQGLRRRKRAAAPTEVLGLAWAGAVVGLAIVLAAWILVGRRLDIGVAILIVMASSLALALLGIGRTFVLRR